MSDAESSQVPVGTILEGKFRVVQEIGRGGMAVVYEAENIDIGKRVAVKLLSPELISSRIIRERFIREARSAAAIHSPYICEVYDSGMYDQRPFLVMELLDGESLYDRMTRIRQLRVSTCLKVLRHIVRGLAKAHEAGVVHRDLKPENIFLTRDADGRLLAKIVDFGLAKFYENRNGEEEKNVRLTREGALFGTPAYMSPEQAKGQGEVDHRADLWALGCIVYECLTGRTVWDVQQGVAMILAQIARGRLPDPLEYRPDLPESFRQWFERALNPDLETRFQTGRAFITSLEEALNDSSEPISSSDSSASSKPYEIPDPAPILTEKPPAKQEAELAPGGTTARAIAWLAIMSFCIYSGYAFWLYVLNPPTASPLAHASQPNDKTKDENALPVTPVERGPGAKFINQAQKLFRSDQHDQAISVLEQALGEHPTVARSLIQHAKVAQEDNGVCRLAGIGRPRPFDSVVPASHARINVGPQGILATWTDNHQDAQRRNIYSALLDDSLRRVSPVRNSTPEATTAIHPDFVRLKDGFAELYWDSGGNKPGVYARIIESDGRIRTQSRLLSSEKKDKYFPTLAPLPNGDMLAVWSEKTASTSRSSIVARRLDSDLKPLGSPIQMTALLNGEATQPYARVFGDTLFISYRFFLAGKTSEIRLLRIPLASSHLIVGVSQVDSEDRSAGESITLRTQPRQMAPSMTCDDKGCLVVWDDESAGAFAGFVPADKEEPLWHREFSTKGKRPYIAKNAEGQALVAYYAGDRLFIAPIDRDGIAKPSVISRVSGFQPTPDLKPGHRPGEWLVAWRDFEAGHLEIFVARAQCNLAGAQ